MSSDGSCGDGLRALLGSIERMVNDDISKPTPHLAMTGFLCLMGLLFITVYYPAHYFQAGILVKKL
ncbi:MAG: hypothetical protein K0Q90_3895 [Paenibacillaceae bacterium]|jgi:hypothetical protein|nr:hypothetical protein [Paenibacillaceae bacterium]